MKKDDKFLIVKLLLIMAAIAGAAVAGKIIYDKYFTRKEEEVEDEDDIFEDDEVRSCAGEVKNAFAEISTDKIEGIFSSKKIDSVLSDITVDLSEADLIDDAELELSCTCSKISVIAPYGVNVVVLESGLINRIHNKAAEGEPGMPTLYITPNSFFSIINIK